MYTDTENSKKLFQAFNKVYRTGEPVKEFNWEVIRKDGTKRFGEVSISLIKDPEGKPIGFRGLARDVSERKEIELELKKHRENLEEMVSVRTSELARTTNFLENIFNSSLDGIITTDVKGNILYASPRIKDILGYEQNEVMGKKVHLFFARGVEESEKIMAEMMKGGGSGAMNQDP
jgi:PAS domain-containing protein